MNISVLTTSLNRANTLDRLFNSLLKQCVPCFEWIFIDDGSTDNTSQLLNDFMSVSEFPVSYVYQKNNGRSQSINRGVELASGDYILLLDSDDMLVPEAVENIISFINSVSRYNKEFSGVCFRKAQLDNVLIGNVIGSCSPMLLSATAAGRIFSGDMAYCFKRKSLLENPFPQFKNEKFVPELYIWNKITDVSHVFYAPSTVITLCEYRSDGLSANFKLELLRSPRGFSLYYGDQIKREKNIFVKFKMLIRYLQCLIYMRWR